jgi:ABC-type nickel/cobalt efflux system permease component RcnA
MLSATYEPVKGDLHRHGTLRHAHSHTGPHAHDSHDDQEHEHGNGGEHAHGHSHGLVDESIKRSREGVRAVALALAILGTTAAVQALVFALSGSLALLADLIHNGGDALTAIPLGIAFALRSPRAERLAGLDPMAWVARCRVDLPGCVAGRSSRGFV